MGQHLMGQHPERRRQFWNRSYTHIVVHAFAIYTRKTKTAREGCKTVSRYIDIIPNTAVFGPTIFIDTITARTTRMKILDEDFG